MANKKVILEIGLNHNGNKDLLISYLKDFSSELIYGFSIQLREKSFYNNKFNKYLLSNDSINKFRYLCKKNNKKFGLAINSDEYSDLIKIIKPDFIKILSYSSRDIKFIKKVRNTYRGEIYISYGLIKKNHSLKYLIQNIKFYKENKIKIIYTKINKLVDQISLKELKKISEVYVNKISYGQHSNEKAIPAIIEYKNIDKIFIYIKSTSRYKYLDDHHAYNQDDFYKVTNLINTVKKISK